jgi:hypothetical protein
MMVAGIVSVGLAVAGVARADGADDDKKITVGGDVQLVIPFSDMANATGPQIGALVRGGYRVIPPLEITGRIGYLAGLSKSQGTIEGVPYSTSISNVPIWLGARYFFMNAPAGLYGAAEIAVNIMTANASAGGSSHGTGITREGFNLGAGYVVSKELPIDVRLQLSDFNLLGTSSGEKALLGIGLSAGYSFFFGLLSV